MQHVWYTTDVLVLHGEMKTPLFIPQESVLVCLSTCCDSVDVAFASSGSVVLVLAISIPPRCLLLKRGQCNSFQNIFCD